MVDAELVTVVETQDAVKAELLRGRLEADGIDCAIQDRNMNQLYGHMIPAVTTMRVQVRRSDAEKAKAILAECGFGGTAPSPTACPQCGSADTVPVRFKQRLLAVLALFVQVPIPLAGHDWRCRRCGHVWRPSSDAPAASQHVS